MLTSQRFQSLFFSNWTKREMESGKNAIIQPEWIIFIIQSYDYII